MSTLPALWSLCIIIDHILVIIYFLLSGKVSNFLRDISNLLKYNLRLVVIVIRNFSSNCFKVKKRTLLDVDYTYGKIKVNQEVTRLAG